MAWAIDTHSFALALYESMLYLDRFVSKPVRQIGGCWYRPRSSFEEGARSRNMFGPNHRVARDDGDPQHGSVGVTQWRGFAAVRRRARRRGQRRLDLASTRAVYRYLAGMSTRWTRPT